MGTKGRDIEGRCAGTARGPFHVCPCPAGEAQQCAFLVCKVGF